MDTTFSGVNQQIANSAMAEVIPVEQTRVITADAAEWGGARTITQAVRNHQITGKDRLGQYLNKGWHGLGEVIEDGLNGEDAVRRYIPWSVERVQASIMLDGKEKLLPVFANVRSDTRDILGIVGPEYTAVQNIEAGRFADALVGADAALRMETCGSLLGGRKIFLLVKSPREIRVGRGGEDVTIPYLLIANGHDGTMALTVMWTMERVCCNNSYTRALGAANNSLSEGTAFRIRHTQSITEALTEARKALGIAPKGITQYEEQAKALAGKTLGVDGTTEYFRSVHLSIYGAKPEGDGVPKELTERWEAKRDEVVAELLGLMDSENQKIAGIGGTLWAALNAVTEWSDHRRSKGVKGNRRDHLNLLGVGAQAKRKAMRLALAAV